MENIFTLVFAIFALCLQVNGECNPLQGICPPIPGLAKAEYSVDFTKQSSLPDGWILANYATVKYGPDGAEFTFNKRKDFSYIWTNFYILFGRVEVVMKAAQGTGIVSSAVLMSDTQDEVDWEWSGNNFGGPSGKVQTNYFGKGVTGNYDRGSMPVVDTPQNQFHTYTFDWSPAALSWEIDGKVVRTHKASDSDTGSHQYPQSPSKFHLGLWCAGDPDTHPETVKWAGGYTDFSKAPYTAFVKSVKITNLTPCSKYEYLDKTGSLKSVKCVNETLTSTSSSSSSSASSPPSPPTSSSASSASNTGTQAPGPTGSPNPSSTPVLPLGSSISASPAPRPACAQDNCLRALLNPRNTASVTPFCSIYNSITHTTDPVINDLAVKAIPTWLANCDKKPERVRSACRCLPTASS